MILQSYLSVANWMIILAWTIPVHGQSEKSTIIWETGQMADIPKGSVVRLVKNADGEPIAFAHIPLSIEYLVTNPSEPFYCNAEIRSGDSVLAMTSAFLVTWDTVKIRFEYLPSISIVTGGENEFINKNRLLLFALPHVIGNNPKYNPALAKASYELNMSDMRLKLYWQEHENAIVETVVTKGDYYFVLERLYSIKERLSLKTLEKCFASLTDTLKRTTIGMKLKTYIEHSKNLFAGLPVPKFSVSNRFRQPVPSTKILDSTKYTFIDFWASWCVPCRAQMKILRELYPRIDTSRLQFVSVSIDNEYEDWLSAAKEENLPWQDYYDPGGSTGEVSKLFAITYIPQNRIIDPAGKLVAFDLWGEGLEAFLNSRALWKEKRTNTKK